MQPPLEKQNYKNIVSMRSRQNNNHKNHVSYFSNDLRSAKDKKEINNKNQKISRNNQQIKELELDHPEPLITDYDEDIYDLKSQFYAKTEKNEINTNQNLKDLPQENKDKNTKNEIIYSDKKNITNNENANNININDKSKIDKEIKINNINSENKTKEEIVKNNTKINISETKNYSLRTFDRRNISSNTDTNYKNIEKVYQTSGKANKNENNNNSHIHIKSNSIIKNQNAKNKNIQTLKVYPSTTCFNTSNLTQKGVIRKLIYQESNKKNIKDIKKNINLQQSFKYNINKININYPKSDLNINIKNNSQYINTQNRQILNRINEENSSNKENINNNASNKINNKLNTNKNPFISLENFNNTKTTVVVFSKFKKIKPVLKANVIPNCSDNKNNQNIVGQKSSTNIIINNSKNSYYEPYSFREEKNNSNIRKIRIKKNNQNTKLLFLDRNNFEINFRNFIKPSKTENNKNANDEISIKNSSNEKQKLLIPNYDYNYDYNYYYGNNIYEYNKNSMAVNYNYTYKDNY